MHELLGSLLSNESAFGRLMTRCGVIIGANLLFVIFSMPVITIGASSAALHYVMFKALRGDGQVNPFKCFWRGFKDNFRRATLSWLALVALTLFLLVDLRICLQAGMPVSLFKYPLYAMLLAEAILAICLFPVMAAFEDTLPRLVRNAFYFAFKRPYVIPALLFFNFFPVWLTCSDPQMLPLYGFLWVFCGYGAIAMLNARLLLPVMKPFLPLVDEYGDFVLTEDGEKQAADAVPQGEEPAESGAGGGIRMDEGLSDEERAARQTLADMERLGM
ncbi:MAG: YesL family protein [Eubacteriales bacterium]|nr:YesL family protein [Eubacteriales bacterium]